MGTFKLKIHIPELVQRFPRISEKYKFTDNNGQERIAIKAQAP